MSNKNIVKGSIIASVLVAAAGFNANASSLFNYNSLGSGQTVRTSLLERTSNSKTIELTCGTDSTKGKDAKCGEGKCGASKKKAKDGKCGATKKS